VWIDGRHLESKQKCATPVMNKQKIEEKRKFSVHFPCTYGVEKGDVNPTRLYIIFKHFKKTKKYTTKGHE